MPPAKDDTKGLFRMAGSRERGSRRRQLQASHQKNWLIGRHAVLETLTAGRWPVQELYVSGELSTDLAAQVRRLAEAVELHQQIVSPQRIAELCHSEHHQGLAARMGPFPYATIESLPSTPHGPDADRVHQRLPVVVICDRIQDTFNFGAILRCCDALGVAAVVIGETEQAGVTPQVARSSGGAVNYVPIVRTHDLRQVVRHLCNTGFEVAAASEKSAAAAWDVELRRSVALVIGSEARGVSPRLLAECQHQLRIPMLGKVTSLNAAVAVGILLYEIRRQQNS